MGKHFVFFLVALLAIATLLPSQAKAQGTDPAAAEALFQKGREAMSEDDYDRACKIFEESFALDPAVGTVMNLAVCEEKRGHFAESWERWHQALGLLSEDDDRVGYAKTHLEAVEGQLAHLAIVPREGAPKELTIRRDDIVLGAAVFGQKLPVNPGAHVVTVESPGHAPRTYTFSLKTGESKELVVAPGRLKKPDDSAPQARNIRKGLGVAALGVGAAGLGVATATGFMMPAQHRKVEAGCPQETCTPEGAKELSRAKTLLAINTVGWIATGVGAAAGVTLLLTLPKSDEKAKKASLAIGIDPARKPSSDRTVGVVLAGSGLQLFGSF